MLGLFNYNDTAKARNSDPVTSHIAAETVNIGEQQVAVLDAVDAWPGETAKQLGSLMDWAKIAGSETAHRRMRELESKLLVYRYLPKGESELRCYITPRGKEYLERMYNGNFKQNTDRRH